MRLRLDPAHTNIPLESVQIFTGLSKRLVFTDYPGGFADVTVEVTDLTGEVHVLDGEIVGDTVAVTVPATATATSGISKAGLKVFAFDADGNEELLGWADFVVLLEDGSITPVSGAIEHKDFAGVETVDPGASVGDLKRTVNDLITKLKG